MMTYLTYIVVFAVIIVLFFILYKIFRFIIGLLVIALIVVIAYLTNPSEEVHRQAVLRKAAETKTSLKKKKISREDFYLFSLTALDENNEHRIIGAGGFTTVFIFSKP